MSKRDRTAASAGAWAPQGAFARLLPALRASVAGFAHATRDEAAFRSELVGSALLVPLAVLLPVSALERLVLVLTMLLVIVVELLNSAIEATVDRISTDHHPLSGQAKDLGSAAVALALAMSVAAWVVIAGPVAAAWVRAGCP